MLSASPTVFAQLEGVQLSAILHRSSFSFSWVPAHDRWFAKRSWRLHQEMQVASKGAEFASREVGVYVTRSGRLHHKKQVTSKEAGGCVTNSRGLRHEERRVASREAAKGYVTGSSGRLRHEKRRVASREAEGWVTRSRGCVTRSGRLRCER